MKTCIAKELEQRIIETAWEARKLSYVPYSGFAVGAGLLAGNGRIFSGCNVENASFGVTNCAERTAIFKAISEGCREFQAIAVAGGRAGEAPDDFCPPCGICLQVMTEFCPPEFPVYLVKSKDEVKRMELKELLPMSFENLKK